MRIEALINGYFPTYDPNWTSSPTLNNRFPARVQLKDFYLNPTKQHPLLRDEWVERGHVVALSLERDPALINARTKLEDMRFWGVAYNGRYCYLMGTAPPHNGNPQVWSRSTLNQVFPAIDSYINGAREWFDHVSMDTAKINRKQAPINIGTYLGPRPKHKKK